MSRKQEKYANGSEGTSARTRPFTFEEIMLRRKNNKSSSEVEGEAGESEKLSVKDNAVTVSNHSELGEAYEVIKTKTLDENEKISSIREQDVEEDQLDRKDNGILYAKSYLVEKPDKEISDKTKEDKSEVGSRFSNRNEDVSADLENETEKDMKSGVEGDKKEKHSHRRSRIEERLRDNLENEPDKEISDKTKEDKSEVGSRFSNRNEDVRADLENETEKDMKSGVEGDKKEKHSHRRSRIEERLRDNLENEPDKVTESKGKGDKNEKSSHCRIRNNEISRDDLEVESNKDIRNRAKGDEIKKQGHHRSISEKRSRDVLENKPDKDMESKAKADKNEKHCHHRSRNEERSRDEYANDKDINDGARAGKIEKQSHHRSRNKDRSRDDFEIESKENIRDIAKGDKNEKQGHLRSKTVDRPRDAFKNEADKAIKDQSKGGKNEKLNHDRSRTEERSRDDFETEADKNIKNRVKGDKNETLSHHKSRNANRPRDDLKTEAGKDVKDRAKVDENEKLSHQKSGGMGGSRDDLEYESDKDIQIKSKGDKNEKQRHYRSRKEERQRDDLEYESDKDIQIKSKGDKNEKQRHYRSRKEERQRDDLENKSDKGTKYKAEGEKNEKMSHPKSKNDEISRSDFEVESKKKCTGRKEKPSVAEKRKLDTESKRKQRPGGDEKDSSYVDGNAVKKHDSGKRYDLEVVGRKSRKESSPSHYDEERPKKRSRSREKKDKNRRSISLSPRAHKRTSYQEWEHESSRKSYSDADKNKISSNIGYGSSHYHRHGGHGSRLGGYSPRKRRSEAGVKTPSPTARSPERKNAGWDLPPTGTDISSAGLISSNLHKSHPNLSSSVNEVPAALLVKSISATEKAVSGASSSTLSASKNSTADNVQPTSPRRRLCVENIPTSASDKSVMECLNNFFLSSNAFHIQGTAPCIHCSINKEKGEALVEFLTPEDATTALSFDGRLFSGSILKVRRPKDFEGSTTGGSQKSLVVADEISDVVKDSPSKIFVGGIAKVLSSAMVMEIASAFGALRGYHFKVDESAGEACAFLEYVDKSITLKACAGLNGMKLGGEVLTVFQATPDASIIESIEEPPSYAIPEHAKPLLSKATKVLKLHNVLNEEELSTLSGQEVEEVLEDVRLECARYGAVKSINIIRSVNSSTTAPGEIINQASVVSSSPQIEDGCNMKRAESTGIKVDQNSGETSRPAALGNVRETLADGADAANSSPSHCENDEEIPDTIIPTSRLGSDATFQDPPSQLDKSKNQCLQTVNTSDDLLLCSDSCIEAEELKPEGDLESQEASIESNDAKDSSAIDNNENTRAAEFLEVGCILVEYARTEASCVAAHCLHGRLYGDRVVAVGYVGCDQYMSRFPK